MKKSLLLRSTIALACISPGLAAPTLTWTTRQLTPEFHAEGAAAGDFNKDGVMDVVYGPWWFVGPSFTEKHQIYPPAAVDPRGYSKNFFNYTPDLNADGWPDVLVLGFPGEESYWFENPKGGEGDWKRHDILKVTDDESPVVGIAEHERLIRTLGANVLTELVAQIGRRITFGENSRRRVAVNGAMIAGDQHRNVSARRFLQ